MIYRNLWYFLTGFLTCSVVWRIDHNVDGWGFPLIILLCMIAALIVDWKKHGNCG